jgi:GNAT superfamily N-acetyltransferase
VNLVRFRASNVMTPAESSSRLGGWGRASPRVNTLKSVSSMSLAIREAHASDAAAISGSLIRSFANDLAAEHSAEFTRQMIALWTTQHVGRLLANWYTLVACPVDEIVGTASLYQNSIRMVAVRSDWHRCGVGTALVRRLIERAAETHSVLTVQSTCFAERFYQKLGFVKQQDHCSNERATSSWSWPFARTRKSHLDHLLVHAVKGLHHSFYDDEPMALVKIDDM